MQSFLNLFSIWLSFFMPYTHLANPTPIFLQIHGLLMSFLLNLCTENLSNTCSNWCLFLCQNIISHHLSSFPAANWAASLLILSLMTSLSTAHRNCVNFWAGGLRLLFKHYIDLKMKVTMLNFDCKNFNVQGKVCGIAGFHIFDFNTFWFLSPMLHSSSILSSELFWWHHVWTWCNLHCWNFVTESFALFFWPGFCLVSFRFCDCTYDSALECLVCEHKVLGSISYVEHDIIKERNKKKLQNQCRQFYFSVTSGWLHGKAWLDKVYGNYNTEGKQSWLG